MKRLISGWPDGWGSRVLWWVTVLGVVASLSILGSGCMEESPDLMLNPDDQAPADGGMAGGAQRVPVPPPPAGEPPATGNDGAAAGAAAAGGPVPGDGAVGESADGAPVVPPGVVPGGGEVAVPDASANSGSGEGQGVVPVSGMPAVGKGVAVPGAMPGPVVEGGAAGAGGPQGPPPPGELPVEEEAPVGFLARLFGGSSAAETVDGSTLGGASGQAAPAGEAPAVGGMPRIQKDHTDVPKHTQEELKELTDVVKLQGTLSCSVCKGPILITVVGLDGLLTNVTGIQPGEFTIYLPKMAGSVNLTAIGDDNEDGNPSMGEPLAGFTGNPLVVEGEDITGITIQIGTGS